MTAEEAARLGALIQRRCGLSFGEDLAWLLASRLGPRLDRLGLPDFAAYHAFLRDDPRGAAELDAAVEALTTHETYLYREPLQLRSFAGEILPALAEQNRTSRRLRVWSAGCATGEEAYTVAVLVARCGLFDGWDVEVLGTDLVRRVLDVARAGVYGERAFREREAEQLRPWFQAEGSRWRVREDVRRRVRFEHLNLLDARAASAVGPIDVAFCRNVLIYLDPSARRRVLRTLADRLRPGGWLLLGHAESLREVAPELDRVQLRHDLCYRKPGRPS